MEYLPGGIQMEVPGGCFPLTTDSMLLAHFAGSLGSKRILDLGSGCGTLGLLLLGRQREITVTGIEQNGTAHEKALENIRRGGLSDRMESILGDLRQAAREFSPGGFDLVVSNPPYFAADSGAVAAGQRGAARSEVTCTLAELCGAASYLLRSGGQLCLVYRAARLAELMALLRSYKLEPKELQTVQKTIDTPPRLVLLRCRKDGGTGLDIRPPLLLQKGDGSESEALGRCYFRDRE